jgi:hypothetical protein
VAEANGSAKDNGAGGTTDNGPGTVSDGLSALADAALKWAPAPAADPDVVVAVRLGWTVSQLEAWTAARAELSDPVLSELPVRLRRDGLEKRIGVLYGQMASRLLQDDQPLRPVADVLVLATASEAKAATSLDDELLPSLFAADPALLKAYNLGRALARLCTTGDDAKVRARLPHAALSIKALLRDLSTKLPDNAAHSIINSLTLWEGEIENGDAAGSGERLRQQSRLWRAILVGEVSATDILRMSDYVGSVEGVSRRLRELAWSTVREMKVLTGIVVVLILGAIALFVVGSSGSVTAGAGSLLAAFGLSWKTLGEFVGRAAAKGEQSLWDAQLDWTIAYRCTIGPWPPPPELEDTRRDAVSRHVATWTAWMAKWPDADPGSGDIATGADPDATPQPASSPAAPASAP